MAKKSKTYQTKQVTAAIRQEYAVLKDMAVGIDSHFSKVRDEFTESELKMVEQFYAFVNEHQVALVGAIKKIIKLNKSEKEIREIANASRAR